MQAPTVEKDEDKASSETGGCSLLHKIGSIRLKTLILGILICVTFMHLSAIMFKYVSHHVAHSTYRWYKTPQDCLKPTAELGEMVDLVERSSKALEKLGIPAPICYGTLWGVLRYSDILSWDNNVDFCVMNEYIRNIKLSDLENAFAEQGVHLFDFSYSYGSFRLQRGLVEGHINVFANCTDVVPLFAPELNVRTAPGQEKLHWACAYSMASVLGKFTHNFNNPVPTELLSPPFTKKRLANIYVNVPHGNIEMQKYIYPSDWWMETKPLGCL